MLTKIYDNSNNELITELIDVPLTVNHNLYFSVYNDKERELMKRNTNYLVEIDIVLFDVIHNYYVAWVTIIEKSNSPINYMDF